MVSDIYLHDDGYYYFDDEDGIPQGPFEDEDQAEAAYLRYLQTI